MPSSVMALSIHMLYSLTLGMPELQAIVGMTSMVGGVSA